MKKFAIVLFGLVVMSWWSATAHGGPRWGMGEIGPGRMMGDGSGMLPMILRGVDLTPEQETRVQEIMKAHRTALRALLQQMREAHDELADKLFAPGEVQAADLTPSAQRIAQIREQLMQEGLKVALEVRGILTPEQLAKVAELKERMKALRAEMLHLFWERD